MSFFPFLLAAWVALRLILLGRQSGHVRRCAGGDSVRHLQMRLAASALGVIGEALLLVWLLPSGGLAWLDAEVTGWPAAIIALSLQAAIWRVVALFGAIVADARASLAGGVNYGRFAGGLALQGLVAVSLLGALGDLLPDHWLLAWLLWAAVALARGWIVPMLVMPLLERGIPLVDRGLATRLHRLLDACGLGDCRLLQTADATSSWRVNARFIGLPGARSILLTHSLVMALTPEQVAAVVAHEAGHCRYRHPEQWLIATLTLALAGFAAVPLVFPLFSFSPPAVVAALWLVGGVGGYFFRPIPAALRRNWEFEADAFAARFVGRDQMISALIRIDGANAAQPTADSLYAAFTAYHPSQAQRLSRIGTRAR
jgi:STE24 endopeptidase